MKARIARELCQTCPERNNCALMVYTISQRSKMCLILRQLVPPLAASGSSQPITKNELIEFFNNHKN